MHMTTWAYPFGNFDRHVAETTAKIGNDMPQGGYLLVHREPMTLDSIETCGHIEPAYPGRF